MALRRLPAISSLTLLIVLGLCAWRPQTASAGFEPVSPAELQMTKEPQAPGAAAVILFRQVDRDDTGRTAHENNYFRIKILTEEGRKYADIEIPFFKDRGTVGNIRARTIRPDGSGLTPPCGYWEYYLGTLLLFLFGYLNADMH